MKQPLAAHMICEPPLHKTTSAEKAWVKEVERKQTSLMRMRSSSGRSSLPPAGAAVDAPMLNPPPPGSAAAVSATTFRPRLNRAPRSGKLLLSGWPAASAILPNAVALCWPFACRRCSAPRNSSARWPASRCRRCAPSCAFWSALPARCCQSSIAGTARLFCGITALCGSVIH